MTPATPRCTPLLLAGVVAAVVPELDRSETPDVIVVAVVDDGVVVRDLLVVGLRLAVAAVDPAASSSSSRTIMAFFRLSAERRAAGFRLQHSDIF